MGCQCFRKPHINRHDNLDDQIIENLRLIMETIDLEEKFHDKEFATALKDEEINVFTAKDKLSDTLDGVAKGKRKIF